MTNTINPSKLVPDLPVFPAGEHYLTKAMSGGTCFAQEGGTIFLRLPAHTTAGYRWQIKKKTGLEIISEQTRGGGAVGGEQMLYLELRVKARTAGKNLKLELHEMPPGRGKPVDTVRFDIAVQTGPVLRSTPTATQERSPQPEFYHHAGKQDSGPAQSAGLPPPGNHVGVSARRAETSAVPARQMTAAQTARHLESAATDARNRSSQGYDAGEGNRFEAYFTGMPKDIPWGSRVANLLLGRTLGTYVIPQSLAAFVEQQQPSSNIDEQIRQRRIAGLAKLEQAVRETLKDPQVYNVTTPDGQTTLYILGIAPDGNIAGLKTRCSAPSPIFY